MQSGPDTLGPSSSFTARKPAASQLHFELPPRPLSTLDTKYPSFAPINSTHSQPQPSGSVASVGNLLTPPNTLPGSSDGVSPASPHGGSSGNTSGAVCQSYSPTGYWPPNSQSSSNYGVQQSHSTQQWLPSREVYSPASLNGIVRQGSQQSEGRSGPGNDFYHLPPFSTSSTAPPVLPAVSTHFQQNPAETSTMSPHSSAPPSASQASGISVSDGFYNRPAHSSSYFSPTHTSTPSSASYSYVSTPSTVQTSPLSAGSQRTQMSPQSSFHDGSGFHHRPSYSQSSTPYQRPPGQYPLPSMGPIMSNMHSPNTNMALVGTLPSNMVPPFTSGQAAHMQQMYGMTQPPSHQAPPGSNDRPFKCDQCMQSFNRNHDLKRHKRIHLAVKPFPCGHCDKSFSRKDALKRHILVKGCGKAQIPGRSSSSGNNATEGPADVGFSSTKAMASPNGDTYGRGDRHLANTS